MKGISLHIGLNQLNPENYGGWSGKLKACEADAIAMEQIARSQGFTTEKLLTKEAKRQPVLDKIYQAAEIMEPGDFYFISYAGHGGQVPDTSGDETDGLDETWCMYDYQLWDDELTIAFCAFKKDVRVLLISDSCHSGTVSRNLFSDNVPKVSPEGIGFRCMFQKEAYSAYRTNKMFYDNIKREIPNPLPVPQASIKSITACRDEQVAADGKKNGYFTTNLLKTWNQGNFEGDYAIFFENIKSKMWWKNLWHGKKQVPVLINEQPSNDMFDFPFKI